MKAQICGYLVLIILIVAANHTSADNKVVVVPLNSSTPMTVGYVGGDQTIYITDADQVVRTITLDIPNNGLVIVNATGHATWAVSSDRTSAARCSISQGTEIDYLCLSVVGSEGTNTNEDNLSISISRAFPLEKGRQTFNLVCDAWESSDSILLRDFNMHAVYYYVPDIPLPRMVSNDASLSTHNCDLNIFCD